MVDPDVALATSQMNIPPPLEVKAAKKNMFRCWAWPWHWHGPVCSLQSASAVWTMTMTMENELTEHRTTNDGAENKTNLKSKQTSQKQKQTKRTMRQ